MASSIETQKLLHNTADPLDNWVVKGLVFVKYPKDDPLGMFFGYYSLLVYEIQAVYITLFLWNRDLLTFYCCFTHLLAEIINYLLKNLIRQPRPDHGAPSGGLFEGRYGMPSQHCHCFAYLAATVILLVFHYYRTHIDSSKKMFVVLISAVALTLQVWGRVYLKFHTLSQCMAGTALGFLSASVFYLIGIHLFLPHSDRICRLWFLRAFSFRRDLVSQPPNLLEAIKHQLVHKPELRKAL